MQNIESGFQKIIARDRDILVLVKVHILIIYVFKKIFQPPPRIRCCVLTDLCLFLSQGTEAVLAQRPTTCVPIIAMPGNHCKFHTMWMSKPFER